MATVVAYNKMVKAGDPFLQIARSIHGAIPFGSVKNLQEELFKAHQPGTIDVLIVADHGDKGFQGMGSGEGRGTRPETNLIHSSMNMSTLLPDGVTIQQMRAGSGDDGNFAPYTNPIGKKEDRREFKKKLATHETFAQVKEIGYIRQISTLLKPKSNGLLLFLGCEVGSGNDGASLVLAIALAIQNSNAACVMASKYKTYWHYAGGIDPHSPQQSINFKIKKQQNSVSIWPARSEKTSQPLQPGDMIGYRGLRELNLDEKQVQLDKIALTAGQLK